MYFLHKAKKISKDNKEWSVNPADFHILNL